MVKFVQCMSKVLCLCVVCSVSAAASQPINEGWFWHGSLQIVTPQRPTLDLKPLHEDMFNRLKYANQLAKEWTTKDTKEKGGQTIKG